MYTLNAAFASHEETIKGSISPGKLADMVLLSRNPTTAAGEEIKDIKVQVTVIGGKVVWEGWKIIKLIKFPQCNWLFQSQLYLF